ncbi:MAG: NAD(P)-binding protein [Pseudomonadota bacterium]
MTSVNCKVKETIDKLTAAINGGGLKNAWSRQRAGEILRLMEDVSWGRGGPEHLPAMAALAEKLAGRTEDAEGAEVGALVLAALSGHAETFESHIQSRNCPSGDCVKLTPAPCQMACPAGIDVPSYLTLIGQGRDSEAIALIRKDNPLPWVCGLVCTNPCEFMCVRGRIDLPVSIKFLKGFAAERAMSEFGYKNPPQAPDNGRKVCIVGAGPAGLSAAYYLALKGYRPTIIEGLPAAGGMMMVGIPRYRLPREVIDRETAMIEDLGVEIRFNTYLGQDATIDSLRAEGFEAFLVAMGAHSCLALKIPGEKELKPVIPAIELLRETALGERHPPGKRVAVIGGGNVAIDAARTSLRLGAEEVTVVYRRTREEMPANVEEVEQAEEEGVHFSFLTMPVKIVGEKGLVTGLHCLRTELGPADVGGRRRPVPVEGSDYVLPLDVIIPAIGQTVHPGGLTGLTDLKWSRRGTITADTASMATTSPGIFAAGDIVTGPATVIEAIGGGKKAAEAIDRYLNGIPQPKSPPVPVRRQKMDCIEVGAATKMSLRRPEMPMLGPDRRRVTFQQVELGYSENAVREEARRCLRCDVCIRCGTCIAVCRDKMRIDALRMGYLDFDKRGRTDFRATAERCIECGACAANCPTGAMTMDDRDGERVLAICGTVLNRLRLLYCENCGAVLGPARYRDYIGVRTNNVAPRPAVRSLCENCARGQAGLIQAEIAPPLKSGV